MSKQKIYILIIFIAFVATNRFAFPNHFWIPQQSSVNTWLYKCSFPDSLHGWAAGDEGKIIHTSNGGLNWIEQVSPVNFFIYSICFTNERLGWGLANDHYGTGTAVLSTTDGGLNWNMFRYPDTTVYFYTIYFHDSLNGWMGGFSGKIVRTTNAGANWIPTQNDTSFVSSFPVHDINFCNLDIGYACGGYYDLAGVIWKTTNGGNYWKAQTVAIEPLNDIFIFDSLKIITVGGDFEFGANLVGTVNGGLNWNYIMLSIFGNASAVSFRTAQEGWIALSYAESFAYTTNSGVNWTVIQTPGTEQIYDVTFSDENHGWAVGKNGTVLKYDTSSVGIKKINQNIIVKAYKLYQNFPNPFNPSTNIEFDIPTNSYVKLSIYDIQGKEVSVLVNKRLQCGRYETSWNASIYPSGVYFYRLETKNFVDTKRMVLFK